MRLRQIEVFHAVYSSGSVTRAAEVLNVSQPSVSKVLRHAEQQLGYPLFERTRGRLVPTPEADRLFVHVTSVYSHIDQLRHVAANLRTANSGTVRIAATPALGIDLLPKSMATFREAHPDVMFAAETLHYDEICTSLLESRLDLGLAFDPGATPGIAEDVLGQSQFYVLAREETDFGGKERISLEDLVGMPFIQLSIKGPLGRMLSTHIESSGVDLNTVAYAETYHVAKAMVSYGMGVTVIDEITARAKGHPDVRAWPFSPKISFRISALHMEGTPVSRVASKFRDHLRETVLATVDAP